MTDVYDYREAVAAVVALAERLREEAEHRDDQQTTDAEHGESTPTEGDETEDDRWTAND